MKADDIELVLGKLLRLHTVVLCYDSYKDNKLNFKEKGFGQLELLVIDGSDITKIIFDPAAAPKVEKIVWTSISSRKADMYGIDKLPSLRQIVFTGSFNMDSIKPAMCKNPNNPILTHKLKDDAATAAASASPIPVPR